MHDSLDTPPIDATRSGAPLIRTAMPAQSSLPRSLLPTVMTWPSVAVVARGSTPSDPGGRSDPTDQPARDVDRLLTAVRERYGYDFRDYATPSVYRRIATATRREKVSSIRELQERVLADRSAFDRLLLALLIPVTAMFRDPEFFGRLRSAVVPPLRERQRIRVWVAGCSTGEEAFSLAILLAEADLLDRTSIVASDISTPALQRARAGWIRGEHAGLD